MLRKEEKNTAPVKAWSERISLYVCPMLLGSVICFSVIYAVYRSMAVPYTLLFTGVELGLYMLFDRIKKRRILGGFIYILMLGLTSAAGIALMYLAIVQSKDWMLPISWFFGAEGVDQENILMLNALFIGGGFFIISILYYFTQIRYRTLGIMLAILFPFVIYARRTNVMPDLMTMAIIVSYLSTMIHNRRIDPARPFAERIGLKADRAYILTMLIFVSLTATIAMTINKPVYLSKMERRDYLSADGAFGAAGENSLETTSRTSAQRYDSRRYNGTPLFNFSTNGENEVYYLRREQYSVFNGDVWEIPSDSYYTNFYYSKAYPEYSTDDILHDMKVVLESIDEGENYSPESLISVKRGRVYSDSFTPVYLPAPIGTIADNEEAELKKYRKFPQGMIVRGEYYLGDTSALDDSFEYYEQSDEFYKYALSLGLSSDELFQLTLLSATDEAWNLYEDYSRAWESYHDQSGVTEDIRELALQITADCQSDMQRALALEQYFELAGYVYDESYIPEDQSIDYFIFESKTGVCTSYATAMTLMARSIDLPARYVEGFAAFEKTEDGSEFIIRDAHAHAFVEVYIPGAGWVTFDPTVSGYMDIEYDDDRSLFDGFTFDPDRYLILTLVLAAVLFFAVRYILYEMVFRITLLFGSPSQRTIRLYANLVRRIGKVSGEDKSFFTVNMLRSFILDLGGESPETLLQLFESTAFGSYEPTSDEYKSAYAEYKKLFKRSRLFNKHKQ